MRGSVLVVDDDASIRELVARILRSRGYAASGEAGPAGFIPKDGLLSPTLSRPIEGADR